jgi:SAM-dependent methyltransferase
MSRIKDVLGYAPLYIASQRIIGADRLRYRCLDQLHLSPGDTVVDVGCGPAYYLDRLPGSVRYCGYDTESRYLQWARRRWGDRGTFHFGPFDSEQAERLAPVDAVLLLGVLHHLADSDSTELFALVARVLAPTGQVVTVDTCFEPSQGRISRWMSENDRGQHVRTPEAFVELARPHFDSVEGEVWADVTRIPGSHWMMRMSGPRP